MDRRPRPTHGLIKASFVPDEELHELRTLMRTRKQLTREQTRHVQRIQKTLTEANIRLDSVISDIMGASGRRMIEAMIDGQRDPRKLAALAHRSVKATPKQLYDALHGRLTEHHRFLLKLHIGQWDALDASISSIDREVDARVARLDRQGPADKARFSDLIDLVDSIPGVNKLSAVSVLSEIGADMTRFDSDGHLIAWTGLCPSQNESAGKRKRTRLRKGAPWLKTALIQCAWAAKNAKTSYYRAQFLRLKARRGPQKAICAVAASILTAIYHMLRDGTVRRRARCPRVDAAQSAYAFGFRRASTEGAARLMMPALEPGRRPIAPPGCWGRRSRSACLARVGS